MRIARVSLGAAARGMTQQNDLAATQPGEPGPRGEAPAAARVYLARAAARAIERSSSR